MEVQPNRPITIVTTAYSDYALLAYQNDVIDYLLKPISLEQFAKAIEKATTYLSGSSLKTSNNTKGKFLSYRANGEIGQLSLSEIIYIESLGNYLKLFSVKQNLPIIVYGSLSSVISQLDSFNFVQVIDLMSSTGIKYFLSTLKP